jgi:sortase A
MSRADRLVRIPDEPVLAPETRVFIPDIDLETTDHPLGRTIGRWTTATGVLLLCFAVWEFGLSGLLQIRAQRSLLAAFKQQVSSGLASSDTFVPSVGQPVAYIQVPSLGITGLVVVEGTTPGLLKSGPGHLPGSALPGEPGNVVIMGRRETYGAPFRHLPQMHPGDQIILTSGRGEFTYQVTKAEAVLPGQPDVIGPTSTPQLTLVTSYPPLRAVGRFAVIASLEGPAISPAPQDPVTLTTSEMGLSGDAGAIGPVLIWAEVLIALAFSVHLARKRGWSRRLVYLLAAPLAIALVLLLFENLDRLLPGTL